MELVYSDEQEEFRTAVAGFLADKSSEQEVRRLMETPTGYDPRVWEQMATQLHLQGIAIPESLGGAGFGIREQALVFEEMGHALLCAPFFASVALAASLLLALDDAVAQRDYLPGIASGATIATVAVLEGTGDWSPDSVRCRAEYYGEWRLTGNKSYVVDGHVSGLVLVVARSPAGIAVFAVDSEAKGLTATPLSTMDQTRRLARITLQDAPARLVGAECGAWQAVERMRDLASIALAAERVGGTRRVVDTAVEYARTRIQFGVPIGSFQAIKHKCANSLLLLEQARSAVNYAAWVADDDPDDLGLASCLALSYCSTAFMHAAAENIQILGGVGFAWEHSAHLYFKRAASGRHLLGGPQEQRRRLAELVGL
jgi:alkylation response protein AidB-like acyl-CoA dehydrogenase